MRKNDLEIKMLIPSRPRIVYQALTLECRVQIHDTALGRKSFFYGKNLSTSQPSKIFSPKYNYASEH